MWMGKHEKHSLGNQEENHNVNSKFVINIITQQWLEVFYVMCVGHKVRGKILLENEFENGKFKKRMRI